MYIDQHIQRKRMKNLTDTFRILQGCVPIIITDEVTEWKATNSWSNKYLLDKMQNRNITISVSPDGRADSVKSVSSARKELVFALPLDVSKTFNEFMLYIDAERHQKLPYNTDHISNHHVYYIQFQNSNAFTQFQPLMSDFPTEIEFFSSVIGSKPDAVNVWMGTSKSVTSIHSDVYENAFCVIRGQKTFRLWPPWYSTFLDGIYFSFMYDYGCLI